MTDLIQLLMDPFRVISILGDGLGQIHTLLAQAPWDDFIRGGIFILLVVISMDAILMVNDRIFSFYDERRSREHHLTVLNNGNTPSVYLIRPIGLAKNLSIDFYSNGNPMILVTQQKKETSAEETAEEAQPAAEQAPAVAPSSSSSGLIPDLSDPMKPVSAVTGAVSQVGKKTGLAASILGTVSSLLPFKSKALQESGAALKEVQQSASQTVGTINTKVNSVDTLKRQVGGLKKPGAGKRSGGSADLRQPSRASSSGRKSVVDMVRNQMSGFVYDEKVWRKNIGKTDETGGTLNYAQSQVLNPGESMKIDLKIKNSSPETDAVSHLYKIEVWQVPQTNLHLAVPRQTISGIVSFPPIGLLEQYLPPALLIGVICFSALVLAVCSKFLFAV